MDDVNCPYCNAGQEINHDNGYGYGEGEIYEQECSDCSKTFVYTTSISFYHDASKADCLNDGEHKFKATSPYLVEFTRMKCVVCGKRRLLTDIEMSKVLAERSK